MIEWFDCHAEYGRRRIPSPLQVPTAADLVNLYDQIGIQRALVVHSAMYEQHPAVGNALNIAETRGLSTLMPTWAILPPQTVELGGVAEFIESMSQAGVRALWAFPTSYLLNGITFGPLFDAMVLRRIPLLVNMDLLGATPGNWAALTALLTEFPDLRVIITLPTYLGFDRYFRPLIECFRGVHITTSRYLLEGGVKSFCEHYGSRRLLFSSGFPDVQPGGSMLALLHAGLNEEDLTNIAGGNLFRLLGEVEI
jgi:hypothetical protein